MRRPGTQSLSRARRNSSEVQGVLRSATPTADRPCRYITRPAIANERLERNGAGDVVLQLKSAWRDGTTLPGRPLALFRAG
ncbi:MAG TPA: transposase [Burkholderiales bacterium]|nr:transposase [Burkholderiales bacterium]